jgi:hypothetical protein
LRNTRAAVRRLVAEGIAPNCGDDLTLRQGERWLANGSSLIDADSPPSRLRRYGAASFAWLAEPKLTLRRQLA